MTQRLMNTRGQTCRHEVKPADNDSVIAISKPSPFTGGSNIYLDTQEAASVLLWSEFTGQKAVVFRRAHLETDTVPDKHRQARV